MSIYQAGGGGGGLHTERCHLHYCDVIMDAIASQITSLKIVYSFIQVQIKASRHWPLCGDFTGEFPAQMASNAEKVSISLKRASSDPNNITHTLGLSLLQNTAWEVINRYRPVLTHGLAFQNFVCKWWPFCSGLILLIDLNSRQTPHTHVYKLRDIF